MGISAMPSAIPSPTISRPLPLPSFSGSPMPPQMEVESQAAHGKIPTPPPQMAATRSGISHLGRGGGSFGGGLGLALLSPGRTTREPMIAAALGFLVQTGYL